MTSPKDWMVYIIECADGSLYTGVTVDLERRLQLHNNGRGAKYTRARGPVMLLWAKILPSQSDALKEEARIKKLPRKEKEKIIPWYGTDSELRKCNHLLRAFYELNVLVPDGGSVPYSLDKLYDTLVDRKAFFSQYSWAVPTEEALLELKSLGPIVEMGAGTGYWAYLLRKLDVDIIAYDKFSGEEYGLGINPWHPSGEKFTDVLQGEPPILRNHADRALFLCWPPTESSMAIECLQNWKGNMVAYVGDFNGITANTAFYDLLRSKFQLVKSISIPRWYGAEDSLTIWSRNKRINP